MRRTIPFIDQWSFHKPGEAPRPVTLPHTRNAADGQNDGNDNRRGAAEYARRFPRPALAAGERAFLSFDGAAMTAEGFPNGRCLCRREGGYSTFRAEITDCLQDQILLTVRLDNGPGETVYPQKADFTFYGGLYRDVSMIVVPEEHFELARDGMPGIRGHVRPQARPRSPWKPGRTPLCPSPSQWPAKR